MPFNLKDIPPAGATCYDTIFGDVDFTKPAPALYEDDAGDFKLLPGGVLSNEILYGVDFSLRIGLATEVADVPSAASVVLRTTDGGQLTITIGEGGVRVNGGLTTVPASALDSGWVELRRSDAGRVAVYWSGDTGAASYYGSWSLAATAESAGVILTALSSYLSISQFRLASSALSEPLAPIASIETPDAAVVGTLVALDGTGSTTVSGTPITYDWSLTAPTGSTAELMGAVRASLDMGSYHVYATTPGADGNDLSFEVIAPEVDGPLGVAVVGTKVEVTLRRISGLLASSTQAVVGLVNAAAAGIMEAAVTSAEAADMLVGEQPETDLIGGSECDSAVTAFLPDIPGLYSVLLRASDGAFEGTATDTIQVVATLLDLGEEAPFEEGWAEVPNVWQMISGRRVLDRLWAGLLRRAADASTRIAQIEHFRSAEDHPRSLLYRWVEARLNHPISGSYVQAEATRRFSGDATSAGALTTYELSLAELDEETYDALVVWVAAFEAGEEPEGEEGDFLPDTPDLPAGFVGKYLEIRGELYQVEAVDGTTVRLDHAVELLQSIRYLTGYASTPRTLVLSDEIGGIEEGYRGLVVGGTYLYYGDKISSVTAATRRTTVQLSEDLLVPGSTVRTHLVASRELMGVRLLPVVEADVTLPTTLVAGDLVLGAGSTATVCGLRDHRIALDAELAAVDAVRTISAVAMPDDVLSVPTLQADPHTQAWAGSVLRQGEHYVVRDGALVFLEGTTVPDVPRLWAEEVHCSPDTALYNSIGHFVGVRPTELPGDYGRSLRVLLHALFTHPSYGSVAAASAVFANVPVIDYAGEILEITETPVSGLGFVTTEDENELTWIYPYDRTLGLAINPRTGATFTVGDTVEIGDVLANGVEVCDLRSRPGFHKPYEYAGLMNPLDYLYTAVVRVAGSRAAEMTDPEALVAFAGKLIPAHGKLLVLPHTATIESPLVAEVPSVTPTLWFCDIPGLPWTGEEESADYEGPGGAPTQDQRSAFRFDDVQGSDPRVRSRFDHSATTPDAGEDDSVDQIFDGVELLGPRELLWGIALGYAHEGQVPRFDMGLHYDAGAPSEGDDYSNMVPNFSVTDQLPNPPWYWWFGSDGDTVPLYINAGDTEVWVTSHRTKGTTYEEKTLHRPPEAGTALTGWFGNLAKPQPGRDGTPLAFTPWPIGVGAWGVIERPWGGEYEVGTEVFDVTVGSEGDYATIQEAVAAAPANPLRQPGNVPVYSRVTILDSETHDGFTLFPEGALRRRVFIDAALGQTPTVEGAVGFLDKAYFRGISFTLAAGGTAFTHEQSNAGNIIMEDCDVSDVDRVLQYGSGTFRRCMFRNVAGATAFNLAGGAMQIAHTSRFENCLFRNATTGKWFDVPNAATSCSHVELVHCLFHSTAGGMGEIGKLGSNVDLTMQNCIIAVMGTEPAPGTLFVVDGDYTGYYNLFFDYPDDDVGIAFDETSNAYPDDDLSEDVFVDADGGDFRLNAGDTYALNRGGADAELGHDIDLVERPIGLAPDRGPYEQTVEITGLIHAVEYAEDTTGKIYADVFAGWDADDVVVEAVLRAAKLLEVDGPVITLDLTGNAGDLWNDGTSVVFRRDIPNPGEGPETYPQTFHYYGDPDGESPEGKAQIHLYTDPSLETDADPATDLAGFEVTVYVRTPLQVEVEVDVTKVALQPRPPEVGTLDDAEAAGVTLPVAASDDDEYYLGYQVTVDVDGTPETRTVSAYDGDTHYAAVDPVFSAEPTVGAYTAEKHRSVIFIDPLDLEPGIYVLRLTGSGGTTAAVSDAWVAE